MMRSMRSHTEWHRITRSRVTKTTLREIQHSKHSWLPHPVSVLILCAKLHLNINFIIAEIPSVIIFHNYELKTVII